MLHWLCTTPAPWARHIGRGLLGWGFAFWLLLAAACACNLPLPPQGYVLEQSRMEQMLAQRFPVSKNFNELVDVSALAPSLRMDAAGNRVQAHIPMQVRSRLFGSEAQYQGSMTMSATLGFDAQRQAVVLRQPMLEDFDLGAEAEKKIGFYKPMAVALLSRWLEPELQNYPVYHLRPEQSKWLGKQRRLHIQVQERGLLLTPATAP